MRSIVSHVPQSVFLSDGTFLENIAFGIEKSKIDYERVKNVSQKASELGRQQNPSLSGDPDKVLMSYR